MPKLNDKQKAEVKSKFDIVDEDGTKSLNLKELKLLLSLLNNAKTDKEMEMFMNKADSGKDGTLTYEEFVQAYADEPGPVALKDELRKAFKTFDQNGDGYLDSNEFRVIMMKKGSERLSETEFTDLMNLMDTDKDGKISVDEYINFICPAN
ncbi:squidulin-like [Argopecten irradians]|uniref:squidulin-like n=1 Tax=Argopecten irradians TaxID=31199 RepID=UPI00371DD485